MRTLSLEKSVSKQLSPLLPILSSHRLRLKPDVAVFPVIFQMNSLLEGSSARLKAGERHRPDFRSVKVGTISLG